MKITIRTCDDWVAVYKDGERVWNNHSCDLRIGLQELGIEFDDQDYYDRVNDLGQVLDADGEVEEGVDPFPERLE